MSYPVQSPVHGYNVHMPADGNQYDAASSSYTIQNKHLNAAAPVFRPGSANGMMVRSNSASSSSYHPSSSEQSRPEEMTLNGINRSEPPPRLGLNPNASPFNFFQTPSLSPGALIPPSYNSSHSGMPSPNHISYNSSSGGLQSSSVGISSQDWASPNTIRGARRGPVNQPFKMTGHNSKPSVSLTPAALSVLLASQRPKRKMVVSLPKEGDETSDQGEIVEQDTIVEQDEEASQEQLAAKSEEQSRLRHLRQQWPTRQPLTGIDVTEVGPSVPFDCVASCQVYPEPDDYTKGLPDFIDIYLPVREVWEDLKEILSLERLKKQAISGQSVSSNDIANKRTLDVETSKLSSSNAANDETVPSKNERTLEDSASNSAKRVVLPENSTDLLSSSSTTTHSHNNMSSSIPSAGQPFGPSASSTLGLPTEQDQVRSSSDSEVAIDSSPALGERPKIERGISDQTANQTNVPEDKVESLLKELGRGFGYDVENEQQDAVSATSSHREGDLTAQAQDDGHEYKQWQDQRRKVSGNESDQEVGEADSDLTDSMTISEKYSNPSLEDNGNKRKEELSTSKRAVRESFQAQDESEEMLPRQRSGTGETFASSSIHGEEINPPLRRYSMLPRGPLDHDQVMLDDNHHAQSDGYSSTSRQTTTQLHANAPIFAPKNQGPSKQYHLPMNSTLSSTSHDHLGSLDAAAPAFTPSIFTFTAPGYAPRLPSLSREIVEPAIQDLQGREKRQRHRDDAVRINSDDLSTLPHTSATTQDSISSKEAEVHIPVLYAQNDQISHTEVNPPQTLQESFTFKPTAKPFYPSHSSSPSISASATPKSTVQRIDQALRLDAETSKTPSQDLDNRSSSLQRSLSSKSGKGKRTPLGSAWQQGDAPAMSSRQNSSSSRLREMIQGSEDVATNIEKDDDDDTISDIIEELGNRMDQSLEIWAERILDEVTIMGQIQPALRLDGNEKQSLVDMITGEIQDMVGNHYRTLTESLNEVSFQQNKILESSMVGNDSTTLTTTPRKALMQKVDQDALQNLDDLGFDSTQDVLDAKMMNLQHHLGVALEVALPRAMESVSSQQVRNMIDAAQLNSIINRLESMSVAKEESKSSGMDLSTVDQVVSLLVQRLQPVLQETSNSNNSELIKQQMNDRMTEWERSINAIKETSLGHIRTVLTDSILPHIKTLQTDQVDVEDIAAKVAERISSVLSDSKSRDDAFASEDGPVTLSSVKEVVLEGFQQHGDVASKSVNQDELLQGIIDDIQRQSREKDAKWSDVVDILMPLVQMQEDSNALTKSVLGRQNDMGQTLKELPANVELKLEDFLSTTRQIQEAHQSILDKMSSLELSSLSNASDNDGSIRTRGMEVGQIREDLLLQVDQARRAEMAVRAELMECQTELNTANGHMNNLREQCTRLEARLSQAEKDANNITLKTDNLRQGEQKAVERYLSAEKRVEEAEVEMREVQSLLQATEERNHLLRSHVEQMATEAADNRQDRARERESTAQAIAEALASRKEAELALTTERKDKEESLMASGLRENEARKLIEFNVERAAKAEGQVLMLEKRMAEQDFKIANLQQITANQKQKTAQGGQKLAEVEKKLKEMDEKEKEFMVAHARLAEMEARLRDQDALETGLRSSQENEVTLRQELTMNQMRFLDVEREVMQMKETLVDRHLLDQAKEQLGHDREEIASLRGQLAELQRREGEQPQHPQKRSILSSIRKTSSIGTAKSSTARPAWEQSPSHGSSTWASIHAPNSSVDDDMDPTQVSYIEGEDSFESFAAGPFIQSNESNSRVVEVNEDGWWS